MDNFERNYERTVDKAAGTVDKVGKAANRLQIGCWTVFFNLFFAGFCLSGVYAGYTSWKLDAEGETITGMVVRLVESSDLEGGCCVYSPVVEFEAYGRTYSVEGDNASDPPAYKVGEQVGGDIRPRRPGYRPDQQVDGTLAVPDRHCSGHDDRRAGHEFFHAPLVRAE